MNLLMQSIIQTLFSGFLCTVFLVLFILADKTFSPKVLIMFAGSIICAFLLSVSDAIDNYCKAMMIHLTLRQVVGSFGFILRVGTCVFLVSISQRENKRNLIILFTLFGINAIISIINIWTGWMFDLNPDHSWNMKPLFFVPYVAVLVAISLLFISAIKKIRHYKGESFIAISTIISCFGANAIEIFTEIRYVLPLSFIVCIVFYYLCLNVEIYRRDTLTTLFNRRSFYMDTAKSSRRHNLVILSMDLNDLKLYNDQEGHSAGDLALKTTSNLMIKNFQKSAKIYRTGGDEFIAVFKNKNSDFVEDAVLHFQNDLSKTKYMVACGFAEYKPGDTLAAVLAESDFKMYENKKLLKEQREAKNCS